MEALFALLVGVIVVGAICYLLWWLVDYIGLPEPFSKVAKILVALFAVVYLFGVLAGYVPPFPRLR